MFNKFNYFVGFSKVQNFSGYNFRTWWNRFCLYIAFQTNICIQLKTQIWHFRQQYLNHRNSARITFYISISINTKFENIIRMCFISNFVHKTQSWEIPRVAAVCYGGSYAMIKLYSAVIITRHIYNFKVSDKLVIKMCWNQKTRRNICIQCPLVTCTPVTCTPLVTCTRFWHSQSPLTMCNRFSV